MKIILTICSSMFFLLMGLHSYATDYYINSVTGNDLNNGTSQATPWRTIANINTTTFQPGDKILFQAGQSWTGTIKPQGSGSATNPILIGKYGSGANPILNGDGTVNCSAKPGFIRYCTILLYNQEYWTIRDLEVTNYNPAEEGGITLATWESNNITNYASVTEPPQYAGVNTPKAAIFIQANNIGQVDQFRLLNLNVHGVNGDISNRDNGGIMFHVFNNGSDAPTYFNDILIDSSYVHDVDRVGIFNISDYDNRTFTVNTDWTPTQNFIIRNCTIRRTGGNGIIVRVSNNPIIEKCLFDVCAIKTTGNAVYPYNVDGAVLQFNEARYTKANVGDEDAGGFDSDYKTKNTVIQYNYSHHNDFGSLITGGPGSFNDNTIFRYNIMERDGLIARDGGIGKFAFRIAGTSTNTTVHNNIIYLGITQSNTKIIYHKDWGGIPDRTYYYNNIFYNVASASTYDLVNSTNHLFSYNLYYGNSATNEPTDIRKITANPNFSNSGGGKSGYTIGFGSSAKAAGIRLSSTPAKDFYDNNILASAPIDLGVHQVSLDDAQLFTSSADAFVRAGTYANTTFGSDSLLTIKGTLSADFRRESLLKFDLTTLPYSTIRSATLYLYGSATQVMNVDLYKINSDSWFEGSVTYNTAPAFSTSINDFNVANKAQWYQVDVTSAVQEEVNGNDIISFGLRDDAKTGGIVDFLSRQSSQSAFRPYLSIRKKVVITTQRDAFVQGGTYANTNFGADTALMVKKSPSIPSNDRNTYMNFNVSSVSGTVVQAILHFRGKAVDGTAFTMNAYKTVDTWNEGTITWNNAPAGTTSLGTLNISGTAYKNYSLDITSYLIAEAAGDDQVSILLRDITTANSRLVAKSKESGVDIPYIEIIYASGSGSRIASTSAEPISIKPNDRKEANDELQIFPNPVFSYLTISGDNNNLQSIEVFDLSGKSIRRYTGKSLKENPVLDFSTLIKGIYLIKVRRNNGSIASKKIIKM